MPENTKPPKPTPDVELGYHPHQLFDSWTSNLLGDPSTRIGALTSSRRVATSVKLEMLCDYRVALAQARVSAPLISAPWRIECADESKRAFFEAVWAPLHRAFMLQAVMAIPMGAVGLLKRLEFQQPQATEAQRAEGVAPWNSQASPLILTGTDLLYPPYVAPHFDKSDHFDGIELTQLSAGGRKVIPIEYSLWLTRGLAEAFGDYQGMGRLVYCYRPWWDSMFTLDLRTRFGEKYLDPALIISYPPGATKDGSDPSLTSQTNRLRAIQVGNAYRSGATVALPSDPYINSTDGSFTNIPRWGIKVAEAPQQLGEFDKQDTHQTNALFMGYLMPPQSITDAKAGGLIGSGKSVVETLSDMVLAMSILEWQNIAAHVNEYMIKPMERWNFPADSPPARLVGTGPNGRPDFQDEDMSPLLDMVQKLASRPDVDMAWLDVQKAGERFGWPIKSPEQIAAEKAEKERKAAELAKQMQQTAQPEEPEEGDETPQEEPPQAALSLSQDQVLRLAWPSQDVADDLDAEFQAHYDAWRIALANDLARAAKEQRENEIAAALWALSLWLKDKLRAAYTLHWQIHAGDIDEAAEVELERELATTYALLDGKLIHDLEARVFGLLEDEDAGRLLGPLAQNLRDALGSFTARVGMYAGGVWALVDVARRWVLRSRDPLARWGGQEDGRTCEGCRMQLRAGERPLSRTPRIGTQNCLSKCRHKVLVKGVDY